MTCVVTTLSHFKPINVISKCTVTSDSSQTKRIETHTLYPNRELRDSDFQNQIFPHAHSARQHKFKSLFIDSHHFQKCRFFSLFCIIPPVAPPPPPMCCYSEWKKWVCLWMIICDQLAECRRRCGCRCRCRMHTDSNDLFSNRSFSLYIPFHSAVIESDGVSHEYAWHSREADFKLGKKWVKVRVLGRIPNRRHYSLTRSKPGYKNYRQK